MTDTVLFQRPIVGKTCNAHIQNGGTDLSLGTGPNSMAQTLFGIKVRIRPTGYGNGLFVTCINN
jgi:hypothetical protein